MLKNNLLNTPQFFFLEFVKSLEKMTQKNSNTWPAKIYKYRFKACLYSFSIKISKVWNSDFKSCGEFFSSKLSYSFVPISLLLHDSPSSSPHPLFVSSVTTVLIPKARYSAFTLLWRVRRDKGWVESVMAFGEGGNFGVSGWNSVGCGGDGKNL